MFHRLQLMLFLLLIIGLASQRQRYTYVLYLCSAYYLVVIPNSELSLIQSSSDMKERETRAEQTEDAAS